MDRSLAVAVANAPTCAVDGVFQRHVAPRIDAVGGTAAGGRWGPPGAFSVLYLGRPESSVVVEAYRHLVEDDMDGGLTADHVGPRRLLTCKVDVERVLDLRDPTGLGELGLDSDSLHSDVGMYGPCQRVARVAHQLELWGVIAPAATGLGETLALFEAHVPSDRWPMIVDSAMWTRLPADPRRLRLAGEGAAG